MKIDCSLTYNFIDENKIKDQVAVVIDVLRATTVIITALQRGCPWIRPVSSIDEAKHMSEKFARQKPLLNGERNGLKIDGFDLDNSPRAMTTDVIGQRPLIMTTSNGTTAITRCTDARKIFIGAFINMKSLVERLTDYDNVLLVCSGTLGEVSLEDTACAGAIISHLQNLQREIELTDAARIARIVYSQYRDDLAEMMKHVSSHGRRLMELGFEGDIEYAVRMNQIPLVPYLEKTTLFLKADIPDTSLT